MPTKQPDPKELRKELIGVLSNLIKHMDWVLGQNTPQRPVVDPTPTPQPVQQRTRSIEAIEALINYGQEFYSDERDERGGRVGLAVAMQEAYDKMGSDGIIATLPYLIAGKAHADKTSYLWKKFFFTGLSEENVGIDKKGILVRRGNGIVVIVHGGGILTPDRIKQAYRKRKGFTSQKTAKFTDDEFNNLLRGSLPSGESINLYTVDDVVKGNIPDPFGRYAVWMPVEKAIRTKSGCYDKKGFMNNPLVIARAGTLEYIEKYFDREKSLGEYVGCHHMFDRTGFRQPQGLFLYVSQTSVGLCDCSLDASARFVGVAPKAP
ncbi:MAG: hypothetical protein QXG00_01600 [Candidatus Woesearchaeota archaeon]